MVELHDQPVVSVDKKNIKQPTNSLLPIEEQKPMVQTKVNQTITTVIPETENKIPNKTEDRSIEVSTTSGRGLDPEQRIQKLESQLTKLAKQNETVTDLLFEIKNNVTQKQDIILDSNGNVIDKKNIVKTIQPIAKPKPIVKKLVIKKPTPKKEPKTVIDSPIPVIVEKVKQDVLLLTEIKETVVDKKEENIILQKVSIKPEPLKTFKQFSYLFKKNFYLSEDLQMILLENNYRLDWKIKEDQFITSDIIIEANNIEDLMQILKEKLSIQYRIQDKKVIVFAKS
jgi:hypothetical protein